MSMIQIYYGSATAINLTANNLAPGKARESTLIDSAPNLYIDNIISVKINFAKKAYGYIYFLLSCTDQNGNISYPATGIDSGITLPRIIAFEQYAQLIGTNLLYLEQAFLTSSELKMVIPSIVNSFKGSSPPKWGLVLVNCTDQPIENSLITYQGIALTSFPESYVTTTQQAPALFYNSSIEEPSKITDKFKPISYKDKVDEPFIIKSNKRKISFED